MSYYKKATQGACVENANKKFTIKDKLSYMMGDVGCNMSFALNASLQLFWTQYMGIELWIWGIMILFLKIWDAINDPIMGALIDGLKPKPGQSKFKPWIFFGSFALIFSGAVCFVPITTAPLWLKIFVCLLGYLLWDTSYTIVNVPYGALNSVITTDSAERAQLSTWRSIGAMIANILIMVLLPMFMYDKSNNFLGNRLIVLALFLGVFGLVCFQFLCLYTTERVNVDYNKQKQEHKINYVQSLKAFFTNRAAVSITLVSIFQLLGMAFMQTLSGLFIQQSFPGMSKISGIVVVLGFLPSIFFVPFIKKLVEKFGKKEASTYPLLFGVIAGLMYLLIPFETFNPTLGLALWILPSFFSGVAIAVNSMVIWAMVADCIDSQEVQTGVRQEGIVYATYSLGRKFAQGIGASLISFLLILTKYNPNTGANQVEGVNTNIRILLGVGFFICFAIQFFLLLFGYNLTKKKVEENTAYLKEKNNL